MIFWPRWWGTPQLPRCQEHRRQTPSLHPPYRRILQENAWMRIKTRIGHSFFCIFSLSVLKGRWKKCFLLKKCSFFNIFIRVPKKFSIKDWAKFFKIRKKLKSFSNLIPRFRAYFLLFSFTNSILYLSVISSTPSNPAIASSHVLKSES